MFDIEFVKSLKFTAAIYRSYFIPSERGPLDNIAAFGNELDPIAKAFGYIHGAEGAMRDVVRLETDEDAKARFYELPRVARMAIALKAGLPSVEAQGLVTKI